MRYVRVSLLTACNLFCSYCRPKGSPPLPGPSYGDVSKLKATMNLLIDLGAVKVRFTGGEPTLYRPLPEMIAHVKARHSGVHTAITTNGLLLEQQAKHLTGCGLDSVNVSLDTLDPARFRAITSIDGLERTLRGIDAAGKYIPSVKLNCVVMRGINDDEVARLVTFANSRGLDIRFIELMPSRQTQGTESRFVGSDEIRRQLPFPLVALPHQPGKAARYYQSHALRIKVGFISPVSEPFCSGCDRVRLASDGRLFRCLFSSESLNVFDLLSARPRCAAQEIRDYLSVTKPGIGTLRGKIEPDLPGFATMGG